MKIVFLSILFVIKVIIGAAQKPPLDYFALANWPTIDGEQISNDGRYIVYSIFKNDKIDERKLCVRSSDNLFSKDLDGGTDGRFTQDSRRIIFFVPGDSLCVMELDTHVKMFIPNTRSFKIPDEENGQWLVCHLTTKELLLYDLYSRERKYFPAVNDYILSNTGKVLLIKSESNLDSIKKNTLNWLNLTDGGSISIWQGRGAGNYVFNKDETGLAFLAEDSNQLKAENSIWFFKTGMDSARLLVSSQTSGVGKDFALKDDVLKFSPDGRKLFFTICSAEVAPKPKPDAAAVDIWNYKDEFSQAEQMENLEFDKNPSYRSVIDILDNKIIRLEYENDAVHFDSRLNDGGNDNYLLIQSKVNSWLGYRQPGEKPDLYLINTKDGSHKLIKRKLLYQSQFKFSPGGKYVIWDDPERKAYFSYDIKSGVVKNISGRIPVSFYNEQNETAGPPNLYGLAFWLKDDEAIFVYDRYDIWKIDPAAIKPPVNITNAYGRKNKIVLRYVYQKDLNLLNEPPVGSDANLFLCGLDEKTKKNGFFRKRLGVVGNPFRLIMSPELSYFPDISSSAFSDRIMKAKYADVYMLSRMSSSAYPNLQTTKNFVDFRQVSDLAPQKSFNWLTTELVNWKTFDGRPGEGILFKPENFDPKNRYPIIFYFYERLSDGINRFINPELSQGQMNIPWFVSHGYLVFCPDIHYRVGEPGESVYNYVVSAAKMMSQKPWVDGKRMGIQGHSWGGYEVNYLVTRTGLFAAAASSAGPADFVSEYGTPAFGGKDSHFFLEQGQPRMGITLWQNPTTYIKNSPLFGADNVTTPLLIMHNRKDGVVPWAQGIEFFTALRRLGKKAWMLQYDTGGHVLFDDKSQLDYSTRLSQFFDHYLKDAPAPIWMTRGIPARSKGIETGLELNYKNPNGD